MNYGIKNYFKSLLFLLGILIIAVAASTFPFSNSKKTVTKKHVQAHKIINSQNDEHFVSIEMKR